MKVSFDLDDTLFVSPENFKTEVELKFPFNRIYKEHLRLGTIDLHIYDDISVVQNGRVYGFKVFLIGSQDDQWTEKIKQEIKNIIEIKFQGRK